MKKISLLAMLVAALLAPGCSSGKHGTDSSTRPATSSNRTAAIVTPDLSLAAKVIVVNSAGHFVILNFPDRQLPKLQRTMYIYHSTVKAAEVLITGPKQEEENNIVADIVAGEPQVGDTVRGE
jgi:hypothetical protein